jgi:DNA polymerase III epsilon subunit-like protein
METKDNEEVRRMLNCVRVTANYALAELDIVHELLEEGMNLDAADMVVKIDEAFYKARRALFDARIEVDKLRRSLDKHVSHCLNPIAKTAPKSAKKGRDVPKIPKGLTKKTSDAFKERVKKLKRYLMNMMKEL